MSLRSRVAALLGEIEMARRRANRGDDLSDRVRRRDPLSATQSQLDLERLRPGEVAQHSRRVDLRHRFHQILAPVRVENSKAPVTLERLTVRRRQRACVHVAPHVSIRADGDRGKNDVGDLRLFLMSALILADKLQEAKGGKLSAVPAAAPSDGVAEALNAVAARIEKIAQSV